MTFETAIVPATVGAGSGVALGDAATEGEVIALGELDAVSPDPPQAASASPATKSSSMPATLARDPRLP